jgi:pyridoxal phosphate enzyme, YggS family
MSIAEKIKAISSEIPGGVRLIAVSKTKPIEMIQEAYAAGQRDFGENYPQELKEKYPLLPKDIRWHQIGHLQTNKVKYIAPLVYMIHSVDSLKLLEEINKQAQKTGKVIDCLFEIKIGSENSKNGIDLEGCRQILNSQAFEQMKNVRLCGVMGIGSVTEDKEQTKKEFALLKEIFTTLKREFFADNQFFKEISMGMSSDYKLAIEQGSTMIRVGSNIFGTRNYAK